MARKPRETVSDPNTLAFQDAWQELAEHPLFAPMAGRTWPRPEVSVELVDRPLPGLCRVALDGRIVVSRSRRLEREQWRWVLAHSLLHLGFDHLSPQD